MRLQLLLREFTDVSFEIDAMLSTFECFFQQTRPLNEEATQYGLLLLTVRKTVRSEVVAINVYMVNRLTSMTSAPAYAFRPMLAARNSLESLPFSFASTNLSQSPQYDILPSIFLAKNCGNLV